MTNIVFVVAAALINQSGRICIAKRPAHKNMGGLWEFPGGKVEEEETPEHALMRELKEELGIEVSDSALEPFTFVSHAYDGFHLFMPLYICRKWQGTAHTIEHDELAWVRMAELSQYVMPPADVPLVKALQTYSIDFGDRAG